ncbi:hypothetical protein [Allobaculum sp. Allo2]|uniref:hypothetical protein n=1 Tax=Allobaculum sp. Allo2 TaxID=2853432 RepID=UPI001F6227F3|nr:hypothetical protein [Allobaculum sp. Allo2]UNT92428.1 hypothetical protein KWG61_09615 [Allobaculum sp. Allo2]
MKDDEGNWIGVKRKITLKVVAGPGIFPTGKTFVLDPDSENKSMLDGKGAIEFRSYYAGITRIVAESEGLKSAAITLRTTGDSTGESEADISTLYGSFMNNDGIILTDIEEASAYELRDLNGVPCEASSNEADRQNVLDQDPKRHGELPQPGLASTSTRPWNMEKSFSIKQPYSLTAKAALYAAGKTADAVSEDDWETLVSYDASTIETAPDEITFLKTRPYRNIRVLFDSIPEDEYASFSELKLYSLKSVNEPIKTGYQYLCDLDDLPETIIKNRTADGQPLKHGNTRYSNGVSLPAQTELTVNNFTREDGGYGAFEAEAFNPSSQTVLLRLIAKNQTIYEKTFEPGESAAIRVSVYRCPDVKLETEGHGSISLGNARLSGVRRKLTQDGKTDLSAQFMAAYESLVPGTVYEGELDLTSKTAQNLMITTSLIAPDNTLVDVQSKPLTLKAKEKSPFPCPCRFQKISKTAAFYGL